MPEGRVRRRPGGEVVASVPGRAVHGPIAGGIRKSPHEGGVARRGRKKREWIQRIRATAEWNQFSHSWLREARLRIGRMG